MSVELDEHGRELDAICSCCGEAIPSNEAEDYGGECWYCAEQDPERDVERQAVNVPVCCGAEMAYSGQRGFYCLRCGRGPT